MLLCQITRRPNKGGDVSLPILGRKGYDSGLFVNRPLPLSYWISLQRLSEPLELMKFTLTYDGDLASSGNKPKPAEVGRIRNVFHDQLADLWDKHIVLRQLARTAFINATGGQVFYGFDLPPGEVLPTFADAVPPPPAGTVSLCAPIAVPEVGSFVPLVRKSLYLACALDILFLRQEDPGSLVLQGGDLDGRIKTLFDALRMPTQQEAKGDSLTADPLCCVLESDTLISDVSIKTGRLLGSRTRKVHAVQLWIDVTVKVLRVTDINQCLTSD